jgi:iron-sulfur cluster repair protein YtfE (RIC family)
VSWTSSFEEVEGTMTIQTFEPLSHDALLTLAHKTDAAAADGDHHRLEEVARRFLDALLEHIHSERQLLLRLPPHERQIFTQAQHQLVNLLLTVLTSQGSEPCHCTDLTREVLRVLAQEADDERLTFARDRLAVRRIAMSVTEPLRREHADLRPHVAELDGVAGRLDDWNADISAQLLEIVEFLERSLMPHAHAEEAALYPAVEEAMQAPGATDTMIADHAEIVRRINALAALTASVGSESPSSAETEQLRAQLYGLSAILHLHFAKEEEVLLPVLDAHLDADDAAQLFARMRAVAHPQEGTPE